MQIDKGTCGPEQLHALQAIFDIIWMDLRAGGLESFNGPTDDPEVLRAQIARRVMEYAKAEAGDEDIIGKVLKSFGITAAPYMRVHGLVSGRSSTIEAWMRAYNIES